jgi:hypothetical protein
MEIATCLCTAANPTIVHQGWLFDGASPPAMQILLQSQMICTLIDRPGNISDCLGFGTSRRPKRRSSNRRKNTMFMYVRDEVL